MPKFFYVARDNAGQKVTGAEEAGYQDEVTSRLQARGLIVIDILPEVKEERTLKSEIVSKIRFKRRHLYISENDLVLFCRQLSTLLGAGVTILNSVEIISKQVSSQRLYNVIKDLRKNMEAGLPFHEALAKHPEVFSELWVNLVESGEASGNLAMILNRLAGYLERSVEFKRKIISALIYPAILIVAGLGALLFLTIRIIPTFADLFKQFNIKLPLLTRILIAVSNVIRGSYLILIVMAIVGFFLLRRYIRTNQGRRRYEQLKFNLPIFGEFFRVLIMERFFSEMSTLVESGVPILYSLDITEHSVSNLIMAEIIRKIKEDVRSGKPLSQPFEKSGFFEPMVVQMVAIGEEIGELAPMFKKVNAFYEEYVETFITRFSVLFEPILLVFMGLIIGLIVIGMFLPIFEIARIGQQLG